MGSILDPPGVTQAQLNARTPKVTVGPTQPASPADGDIWIDTTENNPSWFPPAADVMYEPMGTCTKHNGHHTGVHAIPDTYRLMYAHQFGIDPYATVQPFGRRERSASSALTSGTLYLTFLYPNVDVTATKFLVESTVGASSASLVKFGLYLADATNTLRLVASTAELHASYLNTANFFQPPFNSVANYTLHHAMTYAVGMLVVGATGTPATVLGASVGAATALNPRFAEQLTSQADLPSTIANGASGRALTGFGAWLGVSK